MIALTLTVDFGPADKPRFETEVTVPEKSTVLEALMAALPVVTSPKYGMDYFVEAIGGVHNDYRRDFGWGFEINGYRSNVPAERYLVKQDDWVRWVYVASSCA
jgi:hypothetical protein